MTWNITPPQNYRMRTNTSKRQRRFYLTERILYWIVGAACILLYIINIFIINIYFNFINIRANLIIWIVARCRQNFVYSTGLKWFAVSQRTNFTVRVKTTASLSQYVNNYVLINKENFRYSPGNKYKMAMDQCSTKNSYITLDKNTNYNWTKHMEGNKQSEYFALKKTKIFKLFKEQNKLSAYNIRYGLEPPTVSQQTICPLQVL